MLTQTQNNNNQINIMPFCSVDPIISHDKHYNLSSLLKGECTPFEYFSHRYGRDGVVAICYSKEVGFSHPYFVIRRLLKDYDGRKYVEFKVYDLEFQRESHLAKEREYDNLFMSIKDFWKDIQHDSAFKSILRFGASQRDYKIDFRYPYGKKVKVLVKWHYDEKTGKIIYKK